MSAVTPEEGPDAVAIDGAEEEREPAAAPAPFAGARAIAAWSAAIALALVVGWLLGRSTPAAAPRPPASPAAASAPAAPAASRSPDEVERAHQGGAVVSPAAAAAIAELRQRLDAAPDDLRARKELTVRLVEADLLVEAFEQAEAVLAADPNDPDGLYAEGEVRLAMGQPLEAMALLDRVLAQHPDHLLALIARGKAAARVGQQQEAITLWRRALEVAGGRYPPVEELLATAGAGGEVVTGAETPRPLTAHELESLAQ